VDVPAKLDREQLGAGVEPDEELAPPRVDGGSDAVAERQRGDSGARPYLNFSH
jgi:hypothetical protein